MILMSQSSFDFAPKKVYQSYFTQPSDSIQEHNGESLAL